MRPRHSSVSEKPRVKLVTDMLYTGPLYWALAFHANELPDIPTIGVWRFDRTEFDDANLKLQQKEGYRYDLIAKLEYADLVIPFVQLANIQLE